MLVRSISLDIPPTTNRGVKSCSIVPERSAARDCIIVSAGIDWLTLTSVSRETKLRMAGYFGTIAEEDQRLGYKIVGAGGHGYVGKRTRHAVFTHQENRSLLTVSGERAKRTILLNKAGDNASRIDVQITMRLPDEDVDGWLRAQERGAQNAPGIRGIRPKVDHYVSNGKYQTVYIGSKKSDVVIRLYDKFEESKEDRYKGCVRMEVQMRNKASKALWSHLAQEGLGTMYLLRVLLSLLERRGIDISGVDLERQDIIRPPAEPLKEERTKGWWASQVAPSVARYSASGGWQTAFRILFSKALTDDDFGRIMNALSLQWGN